MINKQAIGITIFMSHLLLQTSREWKGTRLWNRRPLLCSVRFWVRIKLNYCGNLVDFRVNCVLWGVLSFSKLCVAVYMGFIWMLLLVAYGQRDPNAFLLKQHVRNSFANSVPDSMTLQDVFTWANTTLLQNLFGEYPGRNPSKTLKCAHTLVASVENSWRWTQV